MRSEYGITKILHCLICKKKIYLAGWGEHMNKYHESHLLDSVCECGFNFTNRRDFIDHFVHSHTESFFACLCGEIFSLMDIDNHFIYHCVCPQCNHFRRYCFCTNNQTRMYYHMPRRDQ